MDGIDEDYDSHGYETETSNDAIDNTEADGTATLLQTAAADIQDHVQQGQALLQNIYPSGVMEVDGVERVKRSVMEMSAETTDTGAEPFERANLVPRSSLAAAVAGFAPYPPPLPPLPPPDELELDEL